MTVTYLPPLTHSYAQEGEGLLREAVPEGPRFARSGRASRWHMIRSAVDMIYPWNPDEIRRHLYYWCGQSASDVMTADEAPAEEPVCGTCYGRREGWERNQNLLFTPRGLTPPKVCPGSTRGDLAASLEGGESRCLVCGLSVRGWLFGGPYNPSWGLCRHAPGPGLVEPCEFHAWRDLIAVRGVDSERAVACRCQIRRAVAS